MEENPKVIFLDAVGTLFGVRESVGHMYAEVAKQFHVVLEPRVINQAFYQVFEAAVPIAFPGAEPAEIPKLEFEWWRGLAVETFQSAGAIALFRDFDAYFDKLYDFFATADPWQVYPDVIEFLSYWRKRNSKLAIISNFDSRIYRVLAALGLDQYFSSVTISTEIGVAKPDPAIFHAALQKYNCQPAQAWHIGDSYSQDYRGAKAAGLRAILLERERQPH